MSYLTVIENTQTWTCPKTATYKIICVAGGTGGNCLYNASTPNYAVGLGGTPTSFGSLLTASGVGGSGGNNNSGTSSAGGGGGYNFIDYGGHGAGDGGGSSRNGGPWGVMSNPPGATYSNVDHNIGSGEGYGAGGGGCGGHGGPGGKLIMILSDITIGTQIPCTIGAGGNGAAGPTGYYGAKGKKGVIVIQEV